MARRYWCGFCDCLHEPGLIGCPNPAKDPERMTEVVSVSLCPNALHELEVVTAGKGRGARGKFIQSAIREKLERVKG